MKNMVFCNYICHVFEFMNKLKNQKRKKLIVHTLKTQENKCVEDFWTKWQLVEEEIARAFFRSLETLHCEKCSQAAMFFLYSISP